MNRSYSKIRHIQEANQNLEKRIIGEQNVPNVDCLVKAGFKYDSTGGPMTRRTVYSTTIDGMNHQYSPNGSVRVFGNGSHKVGNWKCDPTAPNGVRVFGLKNKPMMPM